MPFKLNADGTIAMDADKKQPIFVSADGRESAFDVDSTVATIGRLNGEAKNNRERAEQAEIKLKAFDGIEDGAAALVALETVKNIKAGDLTTAAKVQEIKDAAAKSAQEAVANATRAAQEKEKQLTDQLAQRTSELNTHIIGGSFASSTFIKDKLAIPADMAQKFFGDRFKVEAGKLVPLGADGNPIFSATNHGNHADFEEAIQVMVGQYAHKDSILKGSGASGGGATGGAAAPGAKTMNRAQWDSSSQAQRMEFSKSGGKVVD